MVRGCASSRDTGEKWQYSSVFGITAPYMCIDIHMYCDSVVLEGRAKFYGTFFPGIFEVRETIEAGLLIQRY